MKLFKRLFIVLALWVSGIPAVFAIDDIDLGEIVISQSRMAQHGYKIASNVTVIDQDIIAVSTAQSVNELLKSQLGINMYDNSTSKTSIIDIRGFGDTASRNVLILVNDRKVNPIDISGPDLLQIPLDSIERIEIIRGGGSVLYGDNAVGGVINIITKEGKGDLKGKISTEYGSYDAQAQDVQVSGDYKGFNYYIDANMFRTDGYRINSDLSSNDYNLRLGHKVSDILKIDFISAWHEDKYGLPGGLSDTELRVHGREASVDKEDFAHTKDRSFQMSFDVKPWPDQLELGHLVLDVSYRNRDTYAVFYSFGEFATRRNIDSYGVNGKYIFDETIFGQDVNLVTGIDYYTTDNDIAGSAGNTDDLTISKDEVGFYGFGEYEFVDDVFVNIGSRYQKAYYTFDQRSGTPGYTKSKPDEQVNLAGLKYEYAKGSNAFVNVQQTFRFLATDEWYDSFSGTLNSNLKHQRGIQYETGVKHSFDDKVLVSVTPYWMDLKDEIFYDPSFGFFGGNNNYDKTRRRGVELEESVDLAKFFDFGPVNKVELFNNYTFQDAKFNGGRNDDKDIPMAPKQLVTAGLNLEINKKYKFSMIGHYVGTRYPINDTLNVTSPVKPYVTVDTKLAYDADPFSVFVGVNNIFNEQYFTYVVKSVSSSARDYFPAPERNFNAGMSLKF